jgi:acetyl/propionyl-CoA carboxylase alpha subunit
VDSGLYEGSEVSLYYDPIVAKLISWGKNRHEAVQRMKRALREYRITGVVTTIPFHRRVMDNPKFLEGDISTHFIAEEFKTEERMPEVKVEEEYKLAAMIAALVDFQKKKKFGVVSGETKAVVSAWKAEGRRRGLRRSF